MAATNTAVSLLTVALTHEYFGGDFTPFTAAPLPATAAACGRLGLRLLKTGARLTLYVTPDARRAPKSADYQSALAATTFCWQITPQAAGFAAYTAIDSAGSGQCVVFTSTARGARGGRLTVAATASAGDVWARQALRFDFRPAQPLSAGTVLRLANGSGVGLRDLKVTDPRLVGIDTTESGSGLYQLMQGDRAIAKWFADERPFPPANPGALLVLPGALLAAAFARTIGDKADPSAAPVYTAGYAARSVLWRYHIFNTQADEALSIVPLPEDELTAAAPAAHPAGLSRARKSGPSARAMFRPFADAALPDARSFEAVRPLKLARQPPQRFALNSGSATRYAPLPLAGLAFARSGRSGALCSDIFVYL